MIKIAYHVTTKANALLVGSDNLIKPIRLPNVFLLKTLKDAMLYKSYMQLDCILEVKYHTSQVESRWKPAYAPDGVIKLKQGESVISRLLEGV